MGFLSRVVADAAAPRAEVGLRADDRRPELEPGTPEDAIEVVLDAPSPEAVEPARPNERLAAAQAEPRATDALPSAAVPRGAVREVSAAAETVASAPVERAAADAPVHAPAERVDHVPSEPARSARVEPESTPRAPLKRESAAVETTAPSPIAAGTERSRAIANVTRETASTPPGGLALRSLVRTAPDTSTPDGPTPAAPEPDREADAPLAAASETASRAVPSLAASAPRAVPSTRSEPSTHEVASPPVPAERALPERSASNAPRVHIGHLEVIVVAPEPAPRPAPARTSDLSSRRYLRNI